MALNATFVKQVPHKGSAAGEKYANGGGMYLLVKSTSKYWRMDYRFAGKRKTLAIGVYPDVSLEQARKKRDKAREQLAADTDPSEAKREVRNATVIAASNTFELVAREFHKSKKSAWSPVYSDKWIRLMEVNLFPSIFFYDYHPIHSLLQATRSWRFPWQRKERRTPISAPAIRQISMIDDGTSWSR